MASLPDFQAACNSAAKRQRGVLRSIFALNSRSAHLRKWLAGEGGRQEEEGGGAEEDLLARLPLTQYADYRPLIEAALKASRATNSASPSLGLRAPAPASSVSPAAPPCLSAPSLPAAPLQAAEAGDEEGYASAVADISGAAPAFFAVTTGTTGACKLVPVHASRVPQTAKVGTSGSAGVSPGLGSFPPLL